MSRAGGCGGGGHGGFVGGSSRKGGQKSGSEQTIELDPAIIYFSIANIRNTFSCGRTIESTLEQFRNKELTYKDLPLLLVLTDGKNYYSQNNRRLYLYKKLKSEGLLKMIEVRLKTIPTSKRMSEKFSPAKCSLTARLMREHTSCKSHEEEHVLEKNEQDREDEEDEEIRNAHSDDSDDECAEDQLTQKKNKQKNKSKEVGNKNEIEQRSKNGKEAKQSHEADATANNKTRHQQKDNKQLQEMQQQQQHQQHKKNKKKDKKKSNNSDSENDEKGRKGDGLTDIEKELQKLGIKTIETKL